jgi:hypothetical protein
MGDFTETKTFGTKAYPVEALDTTPLFRRIEPILTPELLVGRYLKGVPGLDYEEEELKDEIMRAMNEVELLTDLNLTKIQRKERIPFDRDHYRSFVFMKTNNGPILSVEEILIESSNGENIYKLPPDWLEMGFAHKRQINLIPILSIFGAAGLKDGQPSNAGLIFIQAVNNYQWLPAFFSVIYTTGVCHKDGHLPQIMNELVGLTAAMEILGNLQSRITYASTSIAQDGVSQSASGPGPQTFQPRIDILEKRKDKLMKKIRAEFHQGYFLSNI